MAKFLVVLALSVFTAQCAVLRKDDASLKRVVRSSCDPCEREHHHHGPPYPYGPLLPLGPPPPPPHFGPPPPPPNFHSQQWTGYVKSADGSQQGVFSGAAASAQDTQASGQAYSLAGAGSDSGAYRSPYPSGSSVSNAAGQSASLTQGSLANAHAGANAVGYESTSDIGSHSNGGEGAFEAGHAGGYNAQHSSSGSSSGGYNEAHESAQTSLQGALGLASQGLQAQPATGGCSTCGKSSYALSNAKSHSGNAIAVSVNG